MAKRSGRFVLVTPLNDQNQPQNQIWLNLDYVERINLHNVPTNPPNITISTNSGVANLRVAESPGEILGFEQA